MPKIITPGQTLGMLTILKQVKNTKQGDKAYLTRCSCGNEQIMSLSNLRRATRGAKSCGCAKRRHGLWGTLAYEAWHGMMARCYDHDHVSFERYGARGITVCQRWHDGANFLADMGEPNAGESIDRIDNNGNYTPENCRWATASEQARNRRSNILVEHDGRVMCVLDWARELEIPPQRVYARINKLGWTALDALGLQPRHHRRRDSKND